MSEFARLLRDSWPALSTEQLSRLESHCDLLLRWNRRLSLTSVDDVGELVRFHYFESLFLGAQLPAGPLSILDVGSGAGFPGIPIAVLRPECHVTLAESRSRKAVFLSETTRDLPNVTVFPGRGEDWKQPADWAVARAIPFESLSWATNLAWLGSAGEGSWDRSIPVPGTVRRVVHMRCSTWNIGPQRP